MANRRSLDVVMLGLACILIVSCQTTGTPGTPPAAAGPGAAEGTPTQSPAVANLQEMSPAGSTSRNGAPGTSVTVRKTNPALPKKLSGGAVKKFSDLYSGVTGWTARNPQSVEYATMAAIVAGMGGFVVVRVRRLRK